MRLAMVHSRRPLAAAARSVSPRLPPGGRRAGVRSPHDHFQSSSLNEIIVACPRQWPEQTDFALQAQCTAGLPAPRCIESWRANGHVAALHTQIGAIRVRAIEARRGSWPATRMAAPKRDAIGARRHQPRHLAVVWPWLEKGRHQPVSPQEAPRIRTARTISHAIRTARATSGTGCKSPPDRASHAQGPPKPPTTQTRVSDGGAAAPATLAARATRAAAGRAAPLRNRAEVCKVQAASGTGRRSLRNRGWGSKDGDPAGRRGGSSAARATRDRRGAGIQCHRKRRTGSSRLSCAGRPAGRRVRAAWEQLQVCKGRNSCRI